MAKKSLLPRGFKAQAERTSLKLRSELSLENHSPLCGFDLAEHLRIKVYRPSEVFPDGTNLDLLLGKNGEGSAWSALTMKTKVGNKIIIHNDRNAPSRQQSDLMHELAHSICGHKQSDQYSEYNLPFFMRDYNPQQEEEATCLGGILQIPREGLVWAIKEGMTKEEMAEHFTASLQMVRFRINTTGVMNQFRYQKRR